MPQTRYREIEVGLDRRDAIAREEERPGALRLGEVPQHLDVIVGEVEAVVLLPDAPNISLLALRRGRVRRAGEGDTHACYTQILDGGYSVTCWHPKEDTDINSALDSKCSICSAGKRTSKVNLALLEGVEVRERRLEKLRGEPHLGRLVPWDVGETCLAREEVARAGAGKIVPGCRESDQRICRSTRLK